MELLLGRGLWRFGLPGSIVTLAVATATAQPAPPPGGKPGDTPTTQPAAEPKKDAGLAKQKYDAARKKFAKKDYAAALPMFREALEASGSSPNARLYIARCLDALGRPDEAYTEFQKTVVEADALAKQDPRYSGTSKSATVEMKPLQEKVALVTIAVSGPAVAATNVTINGTRIEPERLSSPVATKPGAIALDVSADGWAPVHRDLSVPAGTTENVEVKLEQAAASAGGSGSAGGDSSGSSGGTGSSGTVRKVGYVATGVGVTGTMMFLVMAFAAKGRFERIESECKSTRCTDPKYADDISTGKLFTTLANVGLVVGIAGLGAGVPMIVFGGAKEPSDSGRAPGRFLAVTPAVGGVVASGRF